MRNLMKRKLSYLMMAPVITMGAQSALGQGDTGFALEEIVVTATKRAQSTQDIPMSVEAVSGESLDRNAISDMTDLAQTIPAFTIADTADDKNITMRGMGSPAGQRGVEQAVGMFVNGMYNPRSKQYLNAFMDVERIEVLRGPQAVLFGINATAGAINIVSGSNQPGDEFEGKIKVSHELEYGGATATAIVGGGVSDSLGARLVIQHDDTNGYYDSVSGDNGDERNTAARLSLHWEPSNDLSIKTALEYFENAWDGNQTEAISVAAGELPDGKFDLPTNIFSGKWAGFSSPGYTVDGTSGIVTLDYSIGENTLTAIASHSEFVYEAIFDFVGGGVHPLGGLIGPVGGQYTGLEIASREDYEQSAFELRIASPGGEAIDYVAGIYAQQAHTTDNQGFMVDAALHNTFNALFFGGALDNLTPNPATGDPADVPWGQGRLDIDQELWSAFANVTFNVSDTVSVTAGARYTDETKDVERTKRCGYASDGFSLGTDCTEVDASLFPGIFYYRFTAKDTVDSTQFLPELSAKWDVSEDHTFFARIAKGAKSGGMSSSFAAVPGGFLFDEETVIGFEVGSKSRFMDDRAELNATVFHNKYEDLQVTSITFGSAKVDNAGKATIQGLEVDGKVMLTEWLTLGASIAYLDAEYDEYDSATCNALPSRKLPVSPAGGCDAAGFTPPFAAEFSANLFADVVFSLTDSLNLEAGINVYASTDYYTEATFIEEFRQDDYTLVDARIGIAAADDRWSVSLVGKNLGDEILIGSGVNVNGLGVEAVGSALAPTMYHLQGTYNF